MSPAVPPPVTDAGFFGPGSAVWKVDRELAVLLGSGPRALLLQVAHPKVAAAVVEHSRYATDPLGRLSQTLHTIYAFAFDDVPGAMRRVNAVNKRHARVMGVLPEAVGSYSAGSPYQALDQTLLLWVYATLIDSSLLAYETFVARLPPEEAERYYQEMRAAAHVWGIQRESMPESLAALRAWMAERVASGEVAVSAQGRTVAARILRTPAWWIPAPLYAPTALVAAWLLPPVLRAQFGIHWGPRRERLMRLLATLSRAIVPRLPQRIRDVPWATRAERRLGFARTRASATS